MSKYQVMTLAQLAKHIASQLDYDHIWKSKFPNCDFAATDAELKDYNEDQLMEIYDNVYGWCGIRSFHPAMDSTTLFAITDVFGGGGDNICRLYDGISFAEAEKIILEAIRNTVVSYEETVSDDAVLFVEFVSCNESGETIKNGPRTIYAVCQEGICPICGGELEYTGIREDDDDGCTYPWTCTKCGATGSEGYNLQFDGNHYDVQDFDGNEVKILPPENTSVVDDDLPWKAGSEIESAVFAAIQALCPSKLEWDMNLIADMTDAMEILMTTRNLLVCRPWENEDGCLCYSLPESRCAHCTRHKEAAAK